MLFQMTEMLGVFCKQHRRPGVLTKEPVLHKKRRIDKRRPPFLAFSSSWLALAASTAAKVAALAASVASLAEFVFVTSLAEFDFDSSFVFKSLSSSTTVLIQAFNLGIIDFCKVDKYDN